MTDATHKESANDVVDKSDDKDTFRKNYTALSDDVKKDILEIKARAEGLEKMYTKTHSREMSLALTNLEQSVFWATKALSDPAKNSSETSKE